MTTARPGEPAPGEVHAGCTLERLLGRGAMGAVYLARHPARPEPVVLKFLAPDLASNADLRLRFRREWEAQRKVHPHPNVARVLDVRADDAAPCMVMEYVPGTALDQVLQQHGRLPADRAAAIARDMARGLAAVHGHGLIHRDVKPANAIVGPDGRVKIVDFGLAKDLFLSGLTRPGELLGTALYMAPEQWDDDGIDARCDVFGLGATLYHLVCGAPPFQGDDMDEIADACQTGDYAPPRSLVPGCPPELELVIHRALLAAPRFRYQRISDLGDDLGRVLQGEPARVPALTGEAGRFPLLPAEWMTIGSAPDCFVRLEDAGVAPKHAQIRREGSGFVLRDMKSPGGTFVADAQLPPGRPHPLRDGDRLRFGPVALTFRDPLAAAAEVGAAFVQDVARSEQPAPVVDALAAQADPRAFLASLEALCPDRFAEERADRDLRALLGADVARTARAGRAEARERRGAGLPALLGAMTRAGIEGDPTQWLGWWHQVRTTAPEQIGPATPARELRLRAIGGLPQGGQLALDEAGVVLLGRDPRCTLRFDLPGAPRLHATLLRLHRRWIVIDEGSPPGTRLNGAPIRWAFLDPGDALALGPVQLTLEAAAPPPPVQVAAGVFVIDPPSYEALVAARHPSVCLGLVGALAEPARTDWVDAAAAAVGGDGRAALAQRVRTLLDQRAARARGLLPGLLGQDAGPDPSRWQALLAQRRASLPAQLLPRGWQAAARP